MAVTLKSYPLAVLFLLLSSIHPALAQKNGAGQSGNPGGGGSCSFTVSVTPTNPNLCVNQIQTFTARYTVTGGFMTMVTYQWSVNGVDVPGATGSTHTTSFATTGSKNVCCRVTGMCVDPGTYCLLEWWFCGISVQTVSACSVANVTSCGPPCSVNAFLSPSSATLCVGDSQTFTASYTTSDGSMGAPSYQWSVDGVTQPETTSTLAATFSTAGQHTVCVTISSGTCTPGSACSTVTVNPCGGCDLEAWIDPSVVSLCPSQAQTFAVGYTASNGGMGTYQWQIDGVNAGTATTQAASFSTTGQHTVTCTVTVAGCGTRTAKAKVTVTNCGSCVLDPHISPVNPTLCKDSQATFTASAVISGGPAGGTNYQWYVDGGAVNPGGNNATLNYTFTTAGLHTLACAITVEGCGTATAATSVTVNPCLKTMRQPGLPAGQNRPFLAMSCGAAKGGVSPGSGNGIFMSEDPIPTRGFSLTVNIAVNTQVVETNRPMGNAAFTYDLHVATDTLYTAPGQGTLHWVLVDALGTRLDCGPSSANPIQTPGIFSSLARNNDGTFMLTAAGPPDALAEAGNFTYLFDAQGRLTQICDDAGNSQTANWSGSQLSSVSDLSTGRSITFSYTNGQVTGILENGLLTTALSYNGAYLTGITYKDFNGATLQTISYGYNGDGTIASLTHDNDPNTTLTFRYTGAPHLSGSGTVPLLMGEFDSLGRILIDYALPPVGGASESIYVYNNKNGATRYDFTLPTGAAVGADLTTMVLPQLAGATQPLSYTFGYDGAHECTSVSDGFRSANFVYWPNGFLHSFQNSLGQSWTWTFGGANSADLTNATDPAGTLGSATYGGNNQPPHLPTTVTDAEGHAWGLAYNAYGQPITITPPAGSPTGPTLLTYEETMGAFGFAWLKQALDANNNKVTVDSYDALGDPLLISTYPTTGSGTPVHTTQLTWDGAQRLKRVTHPDNKTVQWNYTGQYLTSTVDEAGTTYNFGYCGPCGALTSASGPSGWALSWALDGDRDLKSFTDARSKVTNYNYGLAGELTGVTYPDNTTLGYLYDNQGRVQFATNGRGHQIQLGWDNADRLSGLTFPTTGEPGIGYFYNTDNTLEHVTDAAGSTFFTYTPNGAIQTVTYNYTGLSAIQTLTYAYNPDGSRSTLTWTSGGTTVAVWTYGYDPGGRLVSLNANFSGTVENTGWSYDGEDKLQSQTNQNGTSTLWTYNELRGWPAQIANKKGATNLSTFALTYDLGANSVGNLTRSAETIQGISGTANRDFVYDALYRLTQEKKNNALQNSYGYDLAGNITNRNPNISYTFDNANKYLTSSAGGTVTYDGDGDLTLLHFNSLPFTDYSWNDLSQLIYYHFPSSFGVSTSHVYNGLGQRAYSTGVDGPVISRNFIYDGDLLIGEIDKSGPGSSARPMAAYSWGAAGLVSERLLVTNTSYWYHFGPQGETRQITNSGGTVADTYSYSPYGVKLTGNGGVGINPFLFGGQFGYYSDYGNIILCGARWYDPAQGRWLSRDPITYDGGANLYEYCASNPVGSTDPSGLHSAGWCAPRRGAEFRGGNSGRDWLNNTADLFAGWGDSLSWGATKLARGGLGVDGVVSYDSGFYLGGEILGTAQTLVMGAQGGAALGKRLITKRLEGYAIRASETAQLTARQLRAVARLPRLEKLFRGERVDNAFRQLVSEDWLLTKLVRMTPRGQFGPDVVSRWGRYWWDVTRKSQWAAHVAKYAEQFGRGFPLFY